MDFIIIDENFVKNTDWFDWINQSINTEFLTVGNYPNTKSHQKKYFLDQIVSNKEFSLEFTQNFIKNLLELYHYIQLI